MYYCSHYTSVSMERNTCQYSSSVGDIKQVSDTQKLCYRTVDGSMINLDVIDHQPSKCQEFIVTSPKFNYCRWMMWTVCFYVLGCILQIHLQVTKFVNLSHFWLGLIYAVVCFFVFRGILFKIFIGLSFVTLAFLFCFCTEIAV